MRIEAPSSLNKTQKSKGKKVDSSGIDFANLLAGGASEADQAEYAQETSATSGINPFIFLQEYFDPRQEAEDLYEKGSQILNFLNQIRLELLSGTLTEKNILHLKQALENNNMNFQRYEAQKLYEEVKLRADVELAKLEVAKEKVSV